MGLVTHPSTKSETIECKKWFEARLQDGFEFYVPEIADYELRRKLLQLESRTVLARPDELKSAISFEKPAGRIFLRGRILGNTPPLRVRYGIEAFFAPKERAIELERDLRDGGTAVLIVTGGGRAALKDVMPSPDAGAGRDSE